MSRWPQHKAWFWEYAPFFRALVPLVAGIMCYQYGWLQHLPYYSVAIATVFFAAAYGLSAVALKSPRPVAFLLLQTTLIGCGYSLSAINDAHNNKLWFGNNLNKNATYLARLSETPAEREQSWKLQVELVSIIDDKNVSCTNGKAFVYVYKDELPMFLQKGDTVLLPGNWQPVKNAGNPYEFDYATYCRRNNIAYQQFCQSSQVRLYAMDNPKAASFPDKAHDWCMTQLDEYITDHKTKGLIQAMLLGDEVNLDEDLRQSFSDTGIVHIIAISGGNVMMFFTFISVLLWWVRHRKYLCLKYLIALPLVWFYVIIPNYAIGFSIA